MSNDALRLFVTDSEGGMSKFVTKDKVWVQSFKFETSKHAMHVDYHTYPPQNKVRVITSAKRG